MANFGTAYLQIIPSLQGGVKGLEDEINKGDIGGRTGKNAGNRFTGAMGDMLKTAGGFVLAKAALAIGDAVGSAFTLGLDRYMNIQNAEAKLTALGHSAETVTQIMDNALASVKGTAFGMGEAADTAASLVASGIAPGEQLEEVLTTIANSAAIAGTDMQSMGAIFGKVAASGKVQGDVLAQLADRGVPALQWLADELGVTAEEVTRMASAGEIDFETFQRAMAAGMDPNAAVIMGETLSGSMENAKAALGRFGAEIMDRIGPGIEKALNGIIEGLDWLTGKVGPAFDWVVEKLQPAWQAIQEFFGFGGEDTPFVQGLSSAEGAANPLRIGLEKLRDGFVSFWEKAEPIVKDLSAGLKEWWDEHGPKVTVMAENLATQIGDAMVVAGAAFEKAGEVIEWFWDLFGDDVMREIGSSLTLLMDLFSGASDVVSGVWQTMAGIVEGDWKKAAGGVEKTNQGLETGMNSIMQRIHDRTIGKWQEQANGIIRQASHAREGAIDHLTRLRNRAGELGTDARNWVVDRFGELANGVRTAARNARDWFGSAWDGIKAKASTPVKFVIDTVYNKGIASLWNKVANAFDLKTLPLMSLKGFDRGGWTGPGNRLDVAGLVHADEFVVKQQSRKRFEDKFPGYLTHINDTGDLPGYAAGGRVVAGVGRRHTSGYPWATWAGDFGAGYGGTPPVWAWKNGIVSLVRHLTTSYGKHLRINHDDGTSSLYAHLSRILVNMGQRVRQGQHIANVGWTGNVRPRGPGGAHLHFETMGGPYRGGAAGVTPSMSGSAQASTPLYSSMRDLFGSALGKLGQINGTPWGKHVSSVPHSIADAAWDYGKDLLGFQNGGVMPYDGPAWLSEDGRPELVVGKQLGAMRANSRVFNANDTERLMGGDQYHFHGDISVEGVQDVEAFLKQIKGHALAKHHA